MAKSRHKICSSDSLGREKQFSELKLQADDARTSTVPSQCLRFLGDISSISSKSDSKNLLVHDVIVLSSARTFI